jgi:serine/threonine protein phosphatase 1
MAGRTIAIGDVHGCSPALRTLLDTIGPDADDVVVTLGDYIDRGPDSKGVLDLLLDLAGYCRLVALLGNHEEMLLAALSDRKVLEGWLACGGVEAVLSYGWAPGGPRRGLDALIPQEHWRFLAGCRPFYLTDTHFFVHAGYVPQLPPEEQPAEALRWRVTDRHTARPYRPGITAVVGHTPQYSGEVLDLGFLICIDTNCHRGGWLTALEVGTGQIWQADREGRLRR